MTQSILSRGGWLLGLALLTGYASNAWAQFQPGVNSPYGRNNTPRMGGAGVGGAAGGVGIGGLNPYFRGGSIINTTTPVTSSSTSQPPPPAYDPYAGGGFGWGFGLPDPFGGYMRGSADVINAQSTYMKSREEARLMREQARQARTDTYRRVFETWKYVRDNTPTTEQLRKEFLTEQVKRALNNPPKTEIFSAKSLNDLLSAFEGLPSKKLDDAPAVDLNQDVLGRINLTKDGLNGTGNVALLRDKGKLTFPRAIVNLGPEVEDAIKDLKANAATAFDQATGKDGRVDSKMLDEMARKTRDLSARLSKVVGETDFNEYNEGKRFLSNLENAIQGLRSPDAGKFLTGQGVAEGKSVQELLKNMNQRGLRFAPAVPGDEQAYQMLHGKLVELYNAINGDLAAK